MKFLLTVRRERMKKASLLFTLLSLTASSYATDEIVQNGETRTNPITLSNDGDRAIIEEGGTLATTTNDAILMNDENQTTLNQGTISTTSGVGISSHFNNAVITNNGLISTTGSAGHGIFTQGGSDRVITNSGLISTEGNNAIGIINDGVNNHIINSGTIRSAQSFALTISGTNPTLTLLRGSNLQGKVLATPSFNLNVETGLNLALTLTQGSFTALGISAPFVQVGQTIAVIDPTGLALQADVATDLSDTILDGIYRHRLGCCNPCGCGVWAQGIGSYRKRSQGSNHVGYDDWQEGFLLGYDTPLCGGNVGLFGGVSFGKAEVDERTQKADTISYVGGLTYEKLFCNTFLGLAVAAGYVDWDNDRFVMNNLAPGGVEKARADIDGVFVSPEATLSHRFVSLWCHPLMSFTLRYAGLFLGDYHEKGSATNLSVKDREIDLLTTRFEVTLPYSNSCGSFCWSIEPYAGAFGRYQVGGYRVHGELLGQSITFDQEGPRNLAALLLGFRGIQSFNCLNLFLNLEASFDTEDSTRVLGEGGIGWNF
ncbi:MAG: hypothetical protein K1000chlam4_00338 [Chlamydiae bacterium]|nr:hypothetical protein [Chlamydiota bacterium]